MTPEDDPLLHDREARRAIREDLDATLVVEAAAGTGKTTELVRRVVALVLHGRARLSGIAAVTFTEKAAAEMKLRLRTGLERARAGEGSAAGARQDIERALAELEEARITTIHGFCADLLREHPLEAGVDPLFQVAGDEARAIYAEVFDAWFAEVVEGAPSITGRGVGLRRVLRRRRRDPRAEGPRELLLEAGWRLVMDRDFDAPYTRAPVEREARIDEVLTELTVLAELAGQAIDPTDFLAQNLLHVRRFVEELRCREELRGGARDHDGLEAELRDLVARAKFHWKGRAGGLFAKGNAIVDVRRRRDATHAKLRALLDDLDAALAAELREDLRPLVEAYVSRMARSGRLDFLDLLVRTRDLLLRRPEVREKLAARFSHVLVDEFQDVDPVQAEILLLLASRGPCATSAWEADVAPGKLFVVGDPKQSIYRFRRADIAVYERVKAHLVDGGARVVLLSRSHRADPSIQRAVNAAFHRAMQGDGQARYVPLLPTRAPISTRPTLVALPAPRPHGDRAFVSKWTIESSYAEATGAFVAWLLGESGWTVREGEREVPIAARHVAILLKNLSSGRDDLARPYAEALESHGVRHVLVGGRGFHEREEVRVLRNALAAIERPDDELSVYATLKGPLFAFTDGALLSSKTALGGLAPLRTTAPATMTDEAREVWDALSTLRRLHRARNRRPVADTLLELLGETRAHATFANWPSGEQALANALRVVDLARRFETRGAPSFRAFVERMEEDAEARAREADTPLVEADTDGVRMMTVHASKGLEFPVVVLATPSVDATHERPSRYVDTARRLSAIPLAHAIPRDLRERAPEVQARDREENVRLAYVAATRARDLLVVPTVGCSYKGEEDSWVACLREALRPSRGQRPREAPGCPAFGSTTVLDAPERDFPTLAPDRPGCYTSPDGFDFVVWDPGTLALGARPREGVREELILRADKGETNVRQGLADHEAWRASREARISRASTPSIVTARVTDAAKAMACAAVAREIAPGRAEDRPAGTRFGTLVHAILAEVPLDADGATVARVTARVARLLAATADETTHATKAVIDALGTDTLRAARRATDVRREVWAGTRDGGEVLGGVVDLAFFDGEGWIVVDHKTDRAVPEPGGPYDAQVTLYAEAIARATRQRATPRLLFV